MPEFMTGDEVEKQRRRSAGSVEIEKKIDVYLSWVLQNKLRIRSRIRIRIWEILLKCPLSAIGQWWLLGPVFPQLIPCKLKCLEGLALDW
jgi:hypothetical protein